MTIIKRLLAPSKKSFWVAFFWSVLILYLSFKTPAGTPKIDFILADKLVHFSFYFGFVFLWYSYFYFKNRTSGKNMLVLVIVAIIMGGLIEFGQGCFTTNRQGDVYDALANTIGAISGIWIANVFFKKVI